MTSLTGHNNYTLLSLYERASALTKDGFILGSVNNRYVTKSHVMACHPSYPDQLHLARIEYFCDMNLICFQNRPESARLHIITEWIAYVTFYDQHDCKVWFGGPTQVWAKSLSSSKYIRLSSIKNRVAYCETDIDFGRVIGEQKVLVASINITCSCTWLLHFNCLFFAPCKSRVHTDTCIYIYTVLKYSQITCSLGFFVPKQLQPCHS